MIAGPSFVSMALEAHVILKGGMLVDSNRM